MDLSSNALAALLLYLCLVFLSCLYFLDLLYHPNRRVCVYIYIYIYEKYQLPFHSLVFIKSYQADLNS